MENGREKDSEEGWRGEKEKEAEIIFNSGANGEAPLMHRYC